MKKIVIIFFLIVVMISVILVLENKQSNESSNTGTKISNFTRIPTANPTANSTTSPAGNTTSSPTIKSVKEIKLDKTYYNKRFKFYVSYPSSWGIVDEKDTLPEHQPMLGVYIYVNNISIDTSSLPDIYRRNYIYIYGKVSKVDYYFLNLTADQFITNNGVSGKIYNGIFEGNLAYYLALNYVGAEVLVTKQVKNKYGKIITNVLKSIRY